MPTGLQSGSLQKQTSSELEIGAYQRKTARGLATYIYRRKASARNSQIASNTSLSKQHGGLVPIASLVARERSWQHVDSCTAPVSTEGDKVKMSQRKTPNAKRKTQKQPHVAPYPINFFLVITAYNYRAFLTNNSGPIFLGSRLSTLNSQLSRLPTLTTLDF